METLSNFFADYGSVIFWFVAIVTIIFLGRWLLRMEAVQEWLIHSWENARQVWYAGGGLFLSALIVYLILSNPIWVGLTDIETWHNTYIKNPYIGYEGLSIWGWLGFILFTLIAAFCASRLASHFMRRTRGHMINGCITWKQYFTDFGIQWKALSKLRVRRYTRYYLAFVGIFVFLMFFFIDMTFGVFMLILLLAIVPFFGKETTDKVYYANLWVCIGLIAITGILFESFRRYNPTTYCSWVNSYRSESVRMAAINDRAADLEAVLYGSTQDMKDSLRKQAEILRDKGDLPGIRELYKRAQKEMDSTARLMRKPAVYDRPQTNNQQANPPSVPVIAQAPANLILQPGQKSKEYTVPTGYNFWFDPVGAYGYQYQIRYNGNQVKQVTAGQPFDLGLGVQSFVVEALSEPVRLNLIFWPRGQPRPSSI
ncbi:MAG: hypothetical protein V1765_01330 [bacterium]